MVIALERYLIPMISKNQETSYNLALVRICTTLTKGWFRQFAIDNYPRLSNLDKDLLPIAQDIIQKYPLKQIKPDVLALDPETQAIFESIRPYTKIISSSSFDDFKLKHRNFFKFDIKRNGIKIISPVNDEISVTAIITTVCVYSIFDYKDQGATWSASVVILPSEVMR